VKLYLIVKETLQKRIKFEIKTEENEAKEEL
jgi:hypothetical protein